VPELAYKASRISGELERRVRDELHVPVDGAHRLGAASRWPESRPPGRAGHRAAVPDIADEPAFRSEYIDGQGGRRAPMDRSASRTTTVSSLCPVRPGELVGCGGIRTAEPSRLVTADDDRPVGARPGSSRRRRAAVMQRNHWASRHLPFRDGGDGERPGNAPQSAAPQGSRGTADQAASVHAVCGAPAREQADAECARRARGNANSTTARRDLRPDCSCLRTLGSPRGRQACGHPTDLPAASALRAHGSPINWAPFGNTITIESGRVGVG
jgi:hypothetical protein